MKYRRIDAFEINYEECSVHKNYKLMTTKGMGEARIYVGHDEVALDEFFELDNIESFIFLKNDLLNYIKEAKDEFFNPVQQYKNDISQYYVSNVQLIENCKDNILKLHFVKKYDSQRRYYLVLADKESRSNYNYFRFIALPRVTKLCLVKIQDVKTNKKYIYMKPVFYIDEKEKAVDEDVEIIKLKNIIGTGTRKRQAQYRRQLLDEMSCCIITKVTEDRILEACHIKPYNKCENEHEQYDVNNGIIMTPTYHVLFDLGFISFKDDGTIIISPFLSNLNKQRLNLKDNTKYMMPKGKAKYLSYHRENVFNRIPDFDI